MRARLHGGAVGTELARRGFVLRAPAWSAAANFTAPEIVAAIHRDYAAAGAELVTANTTCAHERDVGTRAAEHCDVAIALARESGVMVAASLAMLPSTIDPEQRTLAYARAADRMHGADVLLLEGFIDDRELLRALAATRQWSGPRWAALAGAGVTRLPDLIEPAIAEGVALIAVHCCALRSAAAALAAARAIAPDAPLGAYPSPELGDTDDDFAQALVECARTHRLAWIGACCGSTPATTAAIDAVLAR